MRATIHSSTSIIGRYAKKSRDYLTVADFIWRWDTDWFWCSKNLLAQNPLVRRLLGRQRLNSVTYQKIMRWNDKWGVTRALARLRGAHTETVIQDIDIPVEHAAEFLAFLLREVGILPIWICPIGGRPAAREFPAVPPAAAGAIHQFRFLGHGAS